MIKKPLFTFKSGSSVKVDQVPLYGSILIEDSDGSGTPKLIYLKDTTGIDAVFDIDDLLADDTLWDELGGASNPTLATFTATADQDTFTTDYNPTVLEVFVEGIKVEPTEYTASNGTSIVLDYGLDEGTWVQIITNNGVAQAVLYENITGAPEIYTQTEIDTNIYTKTEIDTNFASLDDPDLTGTPTAPTATQSTNTTQIATTAFVLANSASDLVDDTTPELGGDLDPNGNAIIGTIEKRIQMAASDIDCETGSVFTKTISGTTTLTVSNPATSGLVSSFILELTDSDTNVTWWSGIKWAGGTAPTLTTTGVDLLGFYTHDAGTTWRGSVLALDSK